MLAPASLPSLRRDLRANLADGVAFSVMVGVGEAYLPAFGLAVGMGEVLAGLLASLPMLAGAVLQLASPAAIRQLGSHRRWVVLCATCQALSFLPLVAAALVGGIPALFVFAIASIYWGAGLATGPAWNTWMEAIVPPRVRPRFFAYRTRLTQVGMVTGLLAGGAALQLGKVHQSPLVAFALLFAVAGTCRGLSAWFLSIQSEPAPSPERLRGIKSREVLARFRKGGGGGLLVYLLAVQAAVWLSGPYFTPYMLKKLDISYGGFALLTASALAAKVISLPFFGRYAQRAGTGRLLWLGGIGIVPVSGLWLVSSNFAYLVLLQVVGGMAWAAYELAMFLSFFETIDARERTSVLTIFNVGNALATVAGSAAGWMLLKLLGESQASYLTLFFLSSLARLATLALLPGISGVFRRPAVVPATRGLSVGPAVGAIDRPILPSMAVEASRSPAGEPAAVEPLLEAADLPAPHWPARAASPTSAAAG